MPPWRELGALRRLLSSLMSLLPPYNHTLWLAMETENKLQGRSCFEPNGGSRLQHLQHLQHHEGAPSYNAESGSKVLPMLQLVTMIQSLSRTGLRSPVIEEILRSPSDLARYLDPQTC